MRRWYVVVAIVVLSLVASATMLHWMGLIDMVQAVDRRLRSIPAYKTHADVYRLGLETEAALQAERDKYRLLQQVLRELEAERQIEQTQIEVERRKIEKQRDQLAQLDRQLQVRKETIDAQIENLRSIETLRVIYGEMRPTEVVTILNEFDDGIIAHILVGMDERDVAGILRAMEPAEAARISQLIGGLSSK